LEPDRAAEGSRPGSGPAAASTVGDPLTEGKCQLLQIHCPREDIGGPFSGSEHEKAGRWQKTRQWS